MQTITRIFDIIPYYLQKNPNQDCAFGFKENGVWKKLSIQEYANKIDNLSYAFLNMGIQKGDKIAIIAGSRPEWNIIDMATMQIGAISVPIYPTISQEDYLYILKHAEIKLLFIDGKELYTKIVPILPQIRTIKHIFTFSAHGRYEQYHCLEECGRLNKNPEKLAQIRDSIKETDLATLIYTSGTTGNPKGVMLSHRNFVSNIKGVSDIPAPWVKRALSFLPLCHVYERMLVYLYQYNGYSVYYAESLATIAENIKEVDPNIMTCVPRLLEKIFDKLYASGKNLSPKKQKLYYWAFSLAEQYQIEGNSIGYNLKHKIADKLIYSKWREAIGGHFDIVVSGGSAIKPAISSFFSAIGMPVYEGYGLTETSPVIAVSRKGKNNRQVGCVGPIMPDIEIKLGENNEICCRGANVMMGYYKDPERTKEAIDPEGWFHTGDQGEFTKHGLLRITGRIKNIFKTSFGKYINPQKLEEACTESLYIEHMAVFGENQKFAAALIVPEFNMLEIWAKENGVSYQSRTELVKHPEVIKFYRNELGKHNHFFGDWEQIKKFELIADEWSQHSGILTPTLKIKRPVVQERYAKGIQDLFA